MNIKLKIGNVEIEKTAALAPMASVADTVFRVLCKQFKASYLVSEMIPVKGLCFNKKIEQTLKIYEIERPMAIQLFGSEPYFFEKAMEIVLKYKPDIIDINMSCPVKKVVKTGAGCKLMTNSKLAEKIVTTVVKNSTVPVTVKIRKGWNEDSSNAVEFSKRMEACGASAITVHARSREAFFSGISDWNVVAKVKENLKIPVILSGDVTDVISAKNAYELTNVDLIMIGRSSFGQPWIFSEIETFLKTNVIKPTPTFKEKMEIMLYHVKKLCEFYGELTGMKRARFHLMHYFTNFKQAAKYRNFCGQLKKFDDLKKLVNNLTM